jgi:uncharacterized protein YcbK (DUF882 family)
MKLEKNFSLHEFKCKDGTEVPDHLIDNVKLLAENLQVLRDHIEKPIIIISGYRTLKYNTKIGGAKRSLHLVAKASDIIIPGLTPLEVKETILQLIKENKMKQGGIGIYSTFVHYDVRGYAARWDRR